MIVLAALGWFYLALLLAGMGGSFGGYAAGMVQALCRPLPDGDMDRRRHCRHRVDVGRNDARDDAAERCADDHDLRRHRRYGRAQRRTYRLAIRARGRLHRGVVRLCRHRTLVQIAITRAALLDAGMASASGLFSGAIFIGAGLYQFSALKHACLKRCQHPFPFFFANWATTSPGVFRLGVKQGLYCLGCCWAMMLVMFAVGVMNVIWMAGIGIVMAIEKMLTGRRFTHAVGVVLIVAGTGIVVAALASHWPVRSS